MQDMTSVKPIWESDYNAMQNYVDSYFQRFFDLRIDSNIFHMDDTTVVLQYDLPSYLFTRKGLHYLLQFQFKDKCKVGDGIYVKLFNQGSRFFRVDESLLNNGDVSSFLRKNMEGLAHSTPQTPIVEELFKLNEKFDRLLGIIEKSTNKYMGSEGGQQ